MSDHSSASMDVNTDTGSIAAGSNKTTTAEAAELRALRIQGFLSDPGLDIVARLCVISKTDSAPPAASSTTTNGTSLSRNSSDVGEAPTAHGMGQIDGGLY